jgi:glycosyltransferase involved in cell wall biosynthesis
MKPDLLIDSTTAERLAGAVVVACPDARPPAYELVRGLANHGLLLHFATSYYHKPGLIDTLLPKFGRRGQSVHRQLNRRKIDGMDESLVRRNIGYDIAIRLENRLAKIQPKLRSRLVRLRTRQFDRQLAAAMPGLAKRGARAIVFFSDVGSEHAMAAARKAGIYVILSMVTGHMDEEMEILERERQRVPAFFPAYLGDGSLDLAELAWLHERRRSDLAQADLVLVPSRHIAGQVQKRSAVPPSRIRVIPYAADPERFAPRPADDKRHHKICRFLFAGGITQRKGLSDLLEAWKLVRRPGWTLSLAGDASESVRKLIPADDTSLKLLGKITYADMPKVMAEHDIFVFPSLFEGSAVVCYEAMAAGLAVITTPQAGSVVNDGEEGLIVPAAAPQKLARAMKTLGDDQELRRDMGESARLRALDFTWDEYRRRTISAISESLFMPFRVNPERKVLHDE